MFGLSLITSTVARFFGGATVKAAMGWELPLAALLAGAAGGGWAAWHLGRAPLRAEAADLRTINAELRTQYTEQARLAALAATARLQAAQERSDALASELLNTLADNAQLSQEATDAIRTSTTGRACFAGAAVRVLQRAPGITTARADGLPSAQPGAAAAGAAAAAPAGAAGEASATAGVLAPTAAGAQPAPELEATDTAVASWMVSAGGLYEACRARLKALIDWHTPATATAAEAPGER